MNVDMTEKVIWSCTETNPFRDKHQLWWNTDSELWNFKHLWGHCSFDFDSWRPWSQLDTQAPSQNYKHAGGGRERKNASYSGSNNGNPLLSTAYLGNPRKNHHNSQSTWWSSLLIKRGELVHIKVIFWLILVQESRSFVPRSHFF